MPPNNRIAIVGAASLRGKELNEALGESPFAAADFVLMDDEEAIGQLEAVGDEVTFIQQITPASFAHADFTFFTGSAELTRKHWQTARRLARRFSICLARSIRRRMRSCSRHGCNTHEALNCTHQLWCRQIPRRLCWRCCLASRHASAVQAAFATVLEPASEYGRGAMDELHQQTVSLLSFQTLPKAFYDMQIAFNATPTAGPEGKIDLQATEARVRRHYRLLSAGSCHRSPFSWFMLLSSTGTRSLSAWNSSVR